MLYTNYTSLFLYFICTYAKKHKACCKKYKPYIFKIQGTYFKISALYFSPSQISDKQQLTKPRQKALFCWFSESCKKFAGIPVFCIRRRRCEKSYS